MPFLPSELASRRWTSRTARQAAALRCRGDDATPMRLSRIIPNGVKRSTRRCAKFSLNYCPEVVRTV
jgi:hypothetical protein